MTTSLDALKKVSTVVADTADFGLLAEYQAQDATTNPSLILAGTKLEKYQGLIDSAVLFGKTQGATKAEQLEATIDKLTVLFGLEILKIVPGRVSTEVDAKLSFDVEASVKKAKKLVAMYKEAGIGTERLYIKLASTWQGIRAAEILESEGINCNLTLLFSFAQAVACAQAKVALISPFVGRIMDWYKKAEGKTEGYAASEDPGVQSVSRIYRYYKAYGYKTIVMGASFRNIGEITELAGCDNITIAPTLLKQLKDSTAEVPLKLDSKNATSSDAKLDMLTEAQFLFMHNEDPMAVEKLAEGIRNFNIDTRKLEAAIVGKLE